MVTAPPFNYTAPQPNLDYSTLTNNIQPDNISSIMNIPVSFMKYSVGDAWPLIVYIGIVMTSMIKLKHPTMVAFTSFFVSTVFATLLPKDDWCKYAMMIISVGSLAAAIYTLVKL